MQCKVCGFKGDYKDFENIELFGEAKCPRCKSIVEKDDQMPKQKCEIYSRVVGYMSPISTWNEGKQSEFKDRRTYEVDVPNVRSQDDA